jgi:AmmeMemoRadiSam system protein B
VPIYKSIELLDRAGMRAASTGSYDVFTKYIEETQNTICGQTPLGILLLTAEMANMNDVRLNWIGYKQSSSVTNAYDSSVSYASGYAVL